MGSPWNALHRSLVTSTIWREPDHVRLVWITMLALADRYGVVEGSIPGLADMARVSIEDCEDALNKLRSPDKWSRTQEYGGRRIEAVDGGWMLLNFAKHRAETSNEKRKEYKREWMREHRRRQKVSTGQSTSTLDMHEDTPEPEPLPDADADPNTTPPNGGLSAKPTSVRRSTTSEEQQVFEYWKSKMGKTEAAKLTADRRAKIRARLAEGRSVSDLKRAIDGCASSRYHMGENDQGKRYDSLELIFRNGDKCEQFMGLVDAPSGEGSSVVRSMLEGARMHARGRTAR